MSYLRGNYRKKAIDIDFAGIGGGFGNWIAGSNLNPDFRFGGFVFGSYASTSASGFVVISAGDAISSTYGLTFASALAGSIGSAMGVKVIPWIFQDFATGGGVLYHLSATGAASADDSVAILVTASTSGTAFSGAVHFLFAGFIASVPFPLR